MAWRNLEFDHLITGYLLMRGDDVAGDQLLAPVSGASDPRMLADTDASERPRADEPPTRHRPDS
jgi:hypothetical protein